MSLPPTSPLNVLLAAVPLLVVLYLMIGRRWGGERAGVAGWLAAVLIAVVAFGAGGLLLMVAFGRAILLSLYVLYIVWMALLLYHVVNEAGAITVIGRALPALAQDQAAQALLLGWVFGSFLQGAAGYGVPAAVVAPLLVGLGFPANTAVVIALVGHGWSVTFGSLGASFFSLVATTGLPGELLAEPAARLLAVGCLACGVGVLWAAGGWAAVRGQLRRLVLLTLIMAGVQYALALAGLYSLAAFTAGLAGLGFWILDFGFWNSSPKSKIQNPKLWVALYPYLLLILVIVLGQTVLERPLSVVELNWNFPAVATSFGWQTPAGPGRSISLFGHAGALLLYASLLSFAWFRWRGRLNDECGMMKDEWSSIIHHSSFIIRKTVRGSVKSTIGITSLVAMAITMQQAGMTQLLAEALSVNTGRFFPFLSPFIGALGAFMTGSNTNSNVLFGQLQQQTAAALNLSVPLILAAQTAGGAIGSFFAPAKVLVGCSTVPGADDGRVLKAATLYGLAILVVLGVLAWS